MTIKETAIEYATNHYVSVIPVAIDKKPLIKWQEFQKRRASNAQINEWWNKYPKANIGVVTGEISGITVIDVEEGGDISKFPPTTTIRTGGGGWHLYYKYDPEVDNKARILPLTDIRGNGGYVVAPPSIHSSGRPYEVISKVKMAQFPKEMFGLEFKKFNKDTKWQDIVNGVPEGSRNEIGSQIIGKLVRAFPENMWETTAWVMFQQWNQTNTPPMGERELRSIFNSITNREFFKPKAIEPEEKAKKVSFYTMTEVVDRSYNELINTKASDIISFGYDWIDNKLTGIFKSDLIVLGGESGTGKTTFATNIIYKASRTHKCCIFALEDRLENYGIRAIYFEIGRMRKTEGLSNYPWNDYRRNIIKDFNFQRYIQQAKDNLANNNIYFCEVSEQINIEVLERLIKQKVEEGIGLFLVDHLHYFDLLRGKSSKADHIEDTMVKLKTIQKKTGARIILVVHYRKLEGRKPSIDSFKDSISIVQNADYVINLWRDRSEGANHFETTLMCPKSRNPNGEFTIKAIFNPQLNDYVVTSDAFGTSLNVYKEMRGLDD